MVNILHRDTIVFILKEQDSLQASINSESQLQFVWHLPLIDVLLDFFKSVEDLDLEVV